MACRLKTGENVYVSKHIGEYVSMNEENCEEGYDIVSIVPEIRPPNKKVIVSMTSYHKRINTCHIAILSLLNGTMKPSIFYLVLSLKNLTPCDLPQELLNIVDRYPNFKIVWEEDDYKTWKKILYVKRNHGDDIICTADDDIMYPKNYLELMYKEFEEYDEECLVTHENPQLCAFYYINSVVRFVSGASAMTIINKFHEPWLSKIFTYGSDTIKTYFEDTAVSFSLFLNGRRVKNTGHIEHVLTNIVNGTQEVKFTRSNGYASIYTRVMREFENIIINKLHRDYANICDAPTLICRDARDVDCGKYLIFMNKKYTYPENYIKMMHDTAFKDQECIVCYTKSGFDLYRSAFPPWILPKRAFWHPYEWIKHYGIRVKHIGTETIEHNPYKTEYNRMRLGLYFDTRFASYYGKNGNYKLVSIYDENKCLSVSGEWKDLVNGDVFNVNFDTMCLNNNIKFRDVPHIREVRFEPV